MADGEDRQLPLSDKMRASPRRPGRLSPWTTRGCPACLRVDDCFPMGAGSAPTCMSTRHSELTLRPVVWFQHVHPHDQAVPEAVAVADPGVREKLRRARVSNHCMDVNRDTAVGLVGEALGVHGARDG